MRRWSSCMTSAVALTLVSSTTTMTMTPTAPTPPTPRYYTTTTRPLWKDIRKGDRGESRRLTFEERAERRSGKNKENRANKQMLIQEAELLVNEDFPAELEDLFVKVSERATMSAMKVLNMAKCLELLDIDTNPGARGSPQQAAQHKLMLAKMAQVVKVNPTTIEIVPNSNAFATPILQRVSRFDGSLQVSKEGNTIKVVIPPITTAHRDKAVEEIKQQVTTLKNKAKVCRNQAARVLQDCELEDQALAELTQALDSTLRSFLDERCAELEAMTENVMTMGLDEADSAV